MFNIPVILLKNLVILPNQEIKLELNNVISGKAINDASSNFKSEILVVAPMDLLEEEPSVDDLPKVGVIAKIKNKIDNDVTVIKTTYKTENDNGTIAIIGPKRMDYERVVSMLEYIKKNIER